MKKLTYLPLSLTLFFLCCQAQAACHLPIDKSRMTLKVVDGVEQYVVSKAHVDALECLDLQAIADGLNENEKLAQLVREYQTLTSSFENNVKDYRQVNKDLNTTLDRSINLTANYDQQVSQYQALTGDYNELVAKYDDLALKYRDIALNRNSFLSLDAGIGLDDNSDIMGIIGVGFKNIRVWGFAHEESSGVMVGGSMPF